METLKTEIKKDAEVLLRSSIEAIFITLHKKYKTKSGDITPSQFVQLDEMEENLSNLFCEQVFQNL